MLTATTRSGSCAGNGGTVVVVGSELVVVAATVVVVTATAVVVGAATSSLVAFPHSKPTAKTTAPASPRMARSRRPTSQFLGFLRRRIVGRSAAVVRSASRSNSSSRVTTAEVLPLEGASASRAGASWLEWRRTRAM
jgi:hypothetical protein